MKIVALCKTFGGEEWIEAMTRSIAPFVEKIVFVNSDVSWTGRRGNSCKREIQRMLSITDIRSKIISLNHNTIDQHDQVMFGYKFIRQNFPKTKYVMLIDTDEVWNNYDLSQAIRFLEKNPGKEAYRCNIYTYIKSPLWRVEPIEPLKPVVFVRSDLECLGISARACSLPYVIMQNENREPIFYHHYVYVRKDFNTILEKIISSHVSEQTQYTDMSVWIPEVWNNLPRKPSHLEGIHPAIGFQKNWNNLTEIAESEMPRILREINFPIVEQFRKRANI